MIKVFIIDILFKLYYLTEYNFLTKLIKITGGPIFIKLFQSMNNLLNFSDEEEMSGSVCDIIVKDNIVKKKLKINIKNDMINSLLLFKKFLIYKNFTTPFYFEDFIKINMEQVDLIKEMEYSQDLCKIFKNIKQVNVINVYFGCEDFILSDFIIGERIDIFLKKPENNRYKNDIYKLLNLSYYLMIASNFFHCDWHFGNFLVNLKDNEVILNILDTGLMSSIKEINDHNKIKNLIKTNFLKPEPINILKFLCFINKNPEAKIQNFIKNCKEINKCVALNSSYQNILVQFLKEASDNELKFPIVILFMFQSIIFLNSIEDNVYDNLKDFSDKKGFSNEIVKYLN